MGFHFIKLTYYVKKNCKCNSNYFNLNFSEPVLCSSIATNGSDFVITGPSGNVPVISAAGNLCSGGVSTTNYATINFNNSGLVTGTYTVSIVNGSDGNTVLDKCGNVMSTTQIATFSIFRCIKYFCYKYSCVLW